MTAGNNAVKLTAKTALKDHWLKAIAACCIYIFAHFICTLSTSLLSIPFGDIAFYVALAVLGLFILLPLMLGVIRFIWRLIMGGDDDLVTVFEYFSSKKKYLKSLKFMFALILRICGISFIVLLPSIAVWIISTPDVYEKLGLAIPIWSSNLNTVWVFLTTISVFVIISISSKYYLTPILFVADENMEVDEALNMSKIISKNTYIDFIFLAFSLTGYIIISLFVIPLIFTLPYFITCYAVHSRFAIADYNLFVEQKNRFEQDMFGDFNNAI